MKPLASSAQRHPQAGIKTAGALTWGTWGTWGAWRVSTSIFRVLLLALPLALWLHNAQAEEEARFSQAELDQMLAPIALYPDTVLSHILIAATYPLEIVQATRWSEENPGLKGAEAVAAVEDKDWDPSVKALVAFPDILKRMNDDLEWTRRLGDATLIQEEQVLDRVQGLRQRAHAEGSLDDMEHVEVVRETKTIVIEPAVREVIYLPYYDSRIVYGHWWWPAHPPAYWHYPRRYYGAYSAAGFYWGPAIHISPWFYFSSFQWHRRQLVVVHHHHHRYGDHYYSGRNIARHHKARHWEHNPRHRRGVAYRARPRDNTIREDNDHRRDRNSRRRGDNITPSRVSSDHRSGDRSTLSTAHTRQRVEEVRQRLSETRQLTPPRSGIRSNERHRPETSHPGTQRARLHSAQQRSKAHEPVAPHRIQPQDTMQRQVPKRRQESEPRAHQEISRVRARATDRGQATRHRNQSAKKADKSSADRARTNKPRVNTRNKIRRN